MKKVLKQINKVSIENGELPLGRKKSLHRVGTKRIENCKINWRKPKIQSQRVGTVINILN
jgi:hypothetical protein